MSSEATIVELYNSVNAGTLILKPDFQRKFVWNDKHKEKFIETILKKYPFPEIYTADGEVDIETKKVTKWVVDGQQRLSSIVQYMNGDEDLKLKKIPSYQQLSDDEKKAFMSYKVVIRDLGEKSEETLKEIFSRINSVNYALNAMELKNALYDGDYITTANKILEDNKVFFKKIEIFSDNEVLRMRDLEFVLTLMSTIENKGYYTSTSENETYIKMYNDEYSNSDNIMTTLKNIFDLILAININDYSMWLKKSNIYTLIIELIRLNCEYKLDADVLRPIIEEFEQNVLSNKNNDKSSNDFAKYYYYSLQGTASKTSRIERGKVLNSFLISKLSK